jgi:PHF5-like protein
MPFSSTAQCAIRMFAQKHLYGYVTNATLEHMVEDVSFVDPQVCRLISWIKDAADCFHAGISDAYYCAECTRLEKDRDGCPKIVNLGASRTDLFYERRRLGESSALPPLTVRTLTLLYSGFKKG